MEGIASITGDKELISELNKLGVLPKTEPFRSDLLKAGKVLRDRIRAAAPKGSGSPNMIGNYKGRKWISSGRSGGFYQDTSYRGGNLRRGIIAGRKFGKEFPYNPDLPIAYVGVHYRIAPHVNFIERGARLHGTTWIFAGRSGGFVGQEIKSVAGTKRGKLTGKKALRLYGYKGQEVFAASAKPGPQQAKPFFRRTVDNNRTRIEEYIAISAWNRVQGAHFEMIKPVG